MNMLSGAIARHRDLHVTMRGIGNTLASQDTLKGVICREAIDNSRTELVGLPSSR